MAKEKVNYKKCMTSISYASPVNFVSFVWSTV